MLMILPQGGNIENLKHFWETLCNLNDRFDYCLDAKKSYLVIKTDFKGKSK